VGHQSGIGGVSRRDDPGLIGAVLIAECTAKRFHDAMLHPSAVGLLQAAQLGLRRRADDGGGRRTYGAGMGWRPRSTDWLVALAIGIVCTGGGPADAADFPRWEWGPGGGGTRQRSWRSTDVRTMGG
jgi:hypothetical protein